MRYLKNDGRNFLAKVSFWGGSGTVFHLDISEDDFLILTLRFGLLPVREKDEQRPAEGSSHLRSHDSENEGTTFV